MKIGEIFSSYEVVQLCERIHYRLEDFKEGDIAERIEEYEFYRLEDVLVKDLEEPCYYVDKDLVEEYKELEISEMPPIVLGYYDDDSYLTIDGGHRTTVVQELGVKKIKAFVAVKGGASGMDDIIKYIDQYCMTCGNEVPTNQELLALDDDGEVIKCTNCELSKAIKEEQPC